MALKAKKKRDEPIDPHCPLWKCPKVQSSVYWPAPIDARLNQLVDAAANAGEKLSKADVLGALVRSATSDPALLGEMVREYRRSEAKDALIDGGDADLIVLDQRRSGQRPHR